MSLFSNELFSAAPENQQLNTRNDEHSVIIYFTYLNDDLDPLHDLEGKLEKVIHEKGVGRYDGHTIAMDDIDGWLFMYGPNAESLFKAVKPIIDKTDFMKGAIATLRFGGLQTDASEIDVEIER